MVWISRSGSRSWNCNQCKENPSLRRKRGNCGGAFRDNLPQSQEDEEGRFVPGYRVAPDCGAGFSDLKIRSCPVADMNRLSPIVSAYNLHKSGLVDLKTIYKNPSIALIDCLNVIQSNQDEAQSRDLEKLKNGN